MFTRRRILVVWLSICSFAASSPAAAEEVKSLAERVEIRRTTYGVPHILAEDLADLQRRIGNIVVAYSHDNEPVRVKDLKAEGFTFVGPTIVYAFMQAVGMVNDHVITCPRHAEVAKLG